MNALHGFSREGRASGARNYVFVIPSVVCSTLLARDIADQIGAITVSHQHGCGHIGPDITQTRDLFAGLGVNPNVADSLIVSLGCETVQGKFLAAELARRGHPAQMVGIQNSGGYDAALHDGTHAGKLLTAGIGDAERVDTGIDQLTIGIAASRYDRRAADLVAQTVAVGARVVIAADAAGMPALPADPAMIAVGEDATAQISLIRNAGSGAQLLAAIASCGSQVLVEFPAENQPPQGFPLAPVVSVASSEQLHAVITDDFDCDAAADASEILDRAIAVFSGTCTKAELRGSASFAIPRLLRTM